jgi:nitroreductase
MELHDAIRARRSVRVFQSTPVARPLIEGIIADATYAPSRWNVQPWHFHVATGAALARAADAVTFLA